jgi:hypothetical protein
MSTNILEDDQQSVFRVEEYVTYEAKVKKKKSKAIPVIGLGGL